MLCNYSYSWIIRCISKKNKSFVAKKAKIFNEEKVKEAFKTGKGVDYKDSCPICFQGTARFFKPSYEKNLVNSWLPKIENLEKRMNSGASFADIGCGYGDLNSFLLFLF